MPNEEYIPKVDDYVIWDRGEYGKDEGWVYFVGDVPEVKKGFRTNPRYITIETDVKPKPNCVYTSGKPMKVGVKTLEDGKKVLFDKQTGNTISDVQ